MCLFRRYSIMVSTLFRLGRILITTVFLLCCIQVAVVYFYMILDDSTLPASGKCSTEIETTLKLEINSLCRWVEKRTALRSIRKKHNIHASKIRLVNAHGMNTVCNGVNVEAKSVAKYLGTIFISA